MVIENKTIKISFRVSEKEHLKILNKSKKANMRLSEYLRYSSLNKNINIIEDFKDFSKELKGIGRNLNQLNILCHQGKITCPDISMTQKKVEEIWELLNLLTDQIKKSRG
ncbi:MobC family plasmid mobilization relaxosome protein [Alkaliphilus sp. MSJ-5]|uniref:MobC family plasmid mobilization relaxosome protein n=1 Tax=Alkaliphilus flagellatus TaxID=2841507 RepID=A0ABS6G344_9FIRM|nr:plasmid mobilization relaxosome protein MobC [Alkaliphilus flagellatus]MBU5676913.1 MobC family plasmid mobilization relaxosome protein [Alkaliphilus flagellatus]